MYDNNQVPEHRDFRFPSEADVTAPMLDLVTAWRSLLRRGGDPRPPGGGWDHPFIASARCVLTGRVVAPNITESYHWRHVDRTDSHTLRVRVANVEAVIEVGDDYESSKREAFAIAKFLLILNVDDGHVDGYENVDIGAPDWEANDEAGEVGP